jgi:hypothetical protein
LGPVAAFYEIPIYLVHMVPAVVLGWLWLQADSTRSRPAQQGAAAALVLFLVITGLLWHAGQPIARGFDGMASGATVPLDAADGVPGARLAMPATDRDTYDAILKFIDAHARTCDTVFALPMHPQINFLSHRRAPFRYFSTALGLQSDADLRDAEAVLQRTPPAAVFWLPEDKYNTPRALQLVDWIAQHFDAAGQIGEFKVFVPKTPLGGPCP